MRLKKRMNLLALVLISLVGAGCSSTKPQIKLWMLDYKGMKLRGFDEAQDLPLSTCVLPGDENYMKPGFEICYVTGQSDFETLKKYLVHIETQLQGCQAQGQP